MELLHTAAAVILGGLATTALVCLAVLPAATRFFGPAPAVESDETLAGIAMAGGPDIVGGVPNLANEVPNARTPAEAMYDHADSGRGESVRADNAEPALVRDTGDGHHRPPDGPSHGPSQEGADPHVDPSAGVHPSDATGFGEDA